MRPRGGVLADEPVGVAQALQGGHHALGVVDLLGERQRAPAAVQRVVQPALLHGDPRQVGEHDALAVPVAAGLELRERLLGGDAGLLQAAHVEQQGPDLADHHGLALVVVDPAVLVAGRGEEAQRLVVLPLVRGHDAEEAEGLAGALVVAELPAPRSGTGSAARAPAACSLR